MGVNVRITREGGQIDKAGLPPAVAALIRRELHVAPMSLTDPFPKKFRVYLERDDCFVVPLHWARDKLKPFQTTWSDVRPAPAPANLTFAGSLRAELRQHEAAKAVLTGWNECGGALLCLPVGFGKVRRRPRAAGPRIAAAV